MNLLREIESLLKSTYCPVKNINLFRFYYTFILKYNTLTLTLIYYLFEDVITAGLIIQICRSSYFIEKFNI